MRADIILPFTAPSEKKYIDNAKIIYNEERMIPLTAHTLLEGLTYLRSSNINRKPEKCSTCSICNHNTILFSYYIIFTSFNL